MKPISMRRFHQISILLGFLTVLMIPLASCSSGTAPTGDSSAGTSDRNSDNAVQVGILVIRDIEFTRAQYEPVLNYLSKKVGRPFVLVPLAQESQFLEVEQGKVDFVISNPLAAVQMRRLYGTEFIATQSLPEIGTQFAGLIIVKSDSPINRIEDLKGKRGACVSLETAAAGCLFQVLHVKQQGLNPFLDFASLEEIASQNTIVQKVINGDIDFGFVNTGQLEAMIKQGLLADTSQIRVLEPRQDDGFAYEHTTRLYPQWSVAAVSSTPPALVESVKQALLEIPPDNPALQTAGLESFVPAVEYASIDQLIEELQLRSWDVQ